MLPETFIRSQTHASNKITPRQGRGNSGIGPHFGCIRTIYQAAQGRNPTRLDQSTNAHTKAPFICPGCHGDLLDSLLRPRFYTKHRRNDRTVCICALKIHYPTFISGERATRIEERLSATQKQIYIRRHELDSPAQWTFLCNYDIARKPPIFGISMYEPVDR